MKLEDLVRALGLEVKAGRDRLDQPVSGGYVGDLLSDVLAHSEKGNIWVTIQTHPNIVAVASMKELSAVLLAGGREPDAEALQKAEEEEIPLLRSSLSAFELVGRLYQLGVAGIGSC
ncbi:MAG: DRTGG domain-containing protein [Desulfobacterota bacterium]|nr:DRTGG domain-containing protein [Thermodesulfobacteriota bacterium]